MAMRGSLFVISGPSGVGKNTIIQEVMRRDQSLALMITATTRAPRPGESHARDYFFLTPDEFIHRIQAGGFAEWAVVHGHHYGTPRDELLQLLDSGRDVLLQVDVQGTRRLMSAPDLEVISIFLMPPSVEALEERLRGRGTDSREVINERLANARNEMSARDDYDYVVVNTSISEAAESILRIIDRERQRAAVDQTASLDV